METDLVLIQRFQNGSADAFGMLYDRYIRKIYDFIYFRTKHRETAEDLTSVSFMKALEKLSTYDDSKGTFQAWLYRIARNTLIDHYRTFKPTQDLEKAYDVSTAPDHARTIDARQLLEKVELGLAGLNEEQREIVIMRAYSGLPYKEIAAILDKTEGSCKMSFSRAIGKLRSEIVPVLSLLSMVSIYQQFYG